MRQLVASEQGPFLPSPGQTHSPLKSSAGTTIEDSTLLFAGRQQRGREAGLLGSDKQVSIQVLPSLALDLGQFILPSFHFLICKIDMLHKSVAKIK